MHMEIQDNRLKWSFLKPKGIGEGVWGFLLFPLVIGSLIFIAII